MPSYFAQPFQHTTDVLQPGIPPSLSNLLTPRNPIPVDSARLYVPNDEYEDNRIKDFYLDVTGSEATVDSSDIVQVSETENFRNEERVQPSIPDIADLSPIQSQPAPVCLPSPSIPEKRLLRPPTKGYRHYQQFLVLKLLKPLRFCQSLFFQ